jgi:rod shape-determining protein MreD
MLFALVAGAVIQSLVPGAALLGRARIPLLLAVVLYYALTNSRGIMLLSAVVAGLLQDSLSFIPPGYSAFCFGAVGMVVNRYKDDLFSESVLTTSFIGAAAGFVLSLGLSLLLWFNDLIGDPLLWWVLRAVGTALLGAACTPIVVSAVRGLDCMVGNVPSKRHPLEDEEN